MDPKNITIGELTSYLVSIPDHMSKVRYTRHPTARRLRFNRTPPTAPTAQTRVLLLRLLLAAMAETVAGAAMRLAEETAASAAMAARASVAQL